MPPVRRHTVYLSDHQISFIIRALILYAGLLHLVTRLNVTRAIREVSEVMPIFNTHTRCTCPMPEGVPP
jgi:hypothetical protein